MLVWLTHMGTPPTVSFTISRHEPDRVFRGSCSGRTGCRHGNILRPTQYWCDCGFSAGCLLGQRYSVDGLIYGTFGLAFIAILMARRLESKERVR